MKKSKGIFNHSRSFWLFVLPSLVLFGVFFLLPLVLSIGLSFTNYDGWKTLDFSGIKNYTKLFSDSEFFKALERTFVYTLISLPFKVIIPLLLALLVSSPKVRGKGATRTMIYIPVLLSSLVVGITINWMFGQEYGLINFIIQNFGGPQVQWALNSNLAMLVISIASNWASTGFYMIIFIGGINEIPESLYEASSIDGANAAVRFFKITIPMLRPTLFLATLLATINLLKEYALVQGITQGGPGKHTTFIIQHIFATGFDQQEYGYASAMSVIVMIIFALIAFVQFKLNEKDDK